MSFPKLDKDLAIISKLGDNPNIDDGLSAEELKAKFDEAAQILKKFLNEDLIAELDRIFAGGDSVPVNGLNMNGAINMNEYPLQNVRDPSSEHEALNLRYALKHFLSTARLINGYSLENNINLNAADVGARPATWFPTLNEIGAVAKVASTDNAIVRFDGTGGAVQNSNVTIDDSGNLVLGGSTIKINGAMQQVTNANVIPAFINSDSKNGLGWTSTSNLGLAPAGYGLGTCTYRQGAFISNFDDAINTGWYAYFNTATRFDGHTFTNGVVEVASYIESRLCQRFYPSGVNYILQRCISDGVWQPWEWFNPPLVPGTEYRTIERINEKAVYKKADSDGKIMYRLDGETEWRYEAPSMKLVWPNASPTSSYGERTEPMDLSPYSAVLIRFRVYTDSSASSAEYSYETTTAICKVGDHGIAFCNSETGKSPAQRAFHVTTTGIKYSDAYYTNGNSLSWSTNILVPIEVYGLKGVFV